MIKTISIKLKVNKEQEILLNEISKEYIRTVNELTQNNESMKGITSKTVDARLPSAIRCQCVMDAKSVLQKQKKKVTKTLAILRKPICIWNNQNFKVDGSTISMPFWINGKSTRIKFEMHTTDRILGFLDNKLGSLRITKKNGKYIAQIPIDIPNDENFHGIEVMGIDLGVRVPAVLSTTNNKIKFIGNGRKNKALRRRFSCKRKELQKKKHIKALKKIKNKEKRIMQDIDHKVSREVVNFAIKNNVGTIHLEDLKNITKKSKTRTSRKNRKELHNWSFYRLKEYITYKAQNVGINVVLVKPDYTSQVCPCCGDKNKSDKRRYKCKTCHSEFHRDIVGSINVMNNINSPLAV